MKEDADEKFGDISRGQGLCSRSRDGRVEILGIKGPRVVLVAEGCESVIEGNGGKGCLTKSTSPVASSGDSAMTASFTWARNVPLETSPTKSAEWGVLAAPLLVTRSSRN